MVALSKPIVAPYGEWNSPLSAPLVASGTLRLSSVVIEGDAIYWLEGRPEQDGRHVIVKRGADGSLRDMTPVQTNVRTRVYEYGGAAYTVAAGVLYYAEFVDQRLYKLTPGRAPEPLTPPGAWRYADASVDPAHPRLVCVHEDHTRGSSEAITTLVSIPLTAEPSSGQIVVSGHDFYAAPRFSPDGSHLSWLAWRHPQMPWDGTELWLARVAADGAIEEPQQVGGGDAVSIVQPEWSPDGML